MKKEIRAVLNAGFGQGLLHHVNAQSFPFENPQLLANCLGTISLFFSHSEMKSFFYTSDLKLLVDIVIREVRLLPCSVSLYEHRLGWAQPLALSISLPAAARAAALRDVALVAVACCSLVSPFPSPYFSLSLVLSLSLSLSLSLFLGRRRTFRPARNIGNTTLRFFTRLSPTRRGASIISFHSNHYSIELFLISASHAHSIAISLPRSPRSQVRRSIAVPSWGYARCAGGRRSGAR